ncbi:hypothetical protein EYR41_003918 [Orbilia oligospora]|uniref:Uncharacterized protein n=1 Tax=Orbilia oligospora TaxID=2813651 RepID=A0A8H2E7Q5_ORBOL|nr:hypothetical protein TWF128_008794 [Orbilia oligospora]TGJ71997.1 hypothetical protein EYR41_003918 [Orbilia oligospora]
MRGKEEERGKERENANILKSSVLLIPLRQQQWRTLSKISSRDRTSKILQTGLYFLLRQVCGYFDEPPETRGDSLLGRFKKFLSKKETVGIVHDIKKIRGGT